jgi:hypothetical protein
MTEKNDGVIRITVEDLAAADNNAAAAAAAPAPAFQPSTLQSGRSYGNVNTAAAEAEPARSEERASMLLQGWFYLGAAGLLGAVAGWGICERGFIDDPRAEAWGNYWLLPMVTMMMLTGFALAESVVERSVKKGLYRLAIVVPLGLICGFVFDRAANIIFYIGEGVVFSLGVRTVKNPAFWMVRAVAWAVFGVASGLIYGLIGKSGKKAKYGVLGGAIGAFIGGIAFDPITLVVHQAVLSRAFGFGVLGLAAGVSMGFVESALKDRWVYVSAGPLAGKQFILYKALTTIGSDQGSDIYLFKDNNIAPQHAVIEIRGTQATLRAQAPVFVSGVPTQSHVLLSGETVQIGRYCFRYNERHR